MESNRRLFLVSLASSAALAACSGNPLVPGSASFPGSSAVGRRRPLGGGSTVPLKFINQGKTATKDIWLSYYGLDPKTGKPMHLVDATGKLAANVPTSKATDALAINAGSAESFIIPELNAGRLYVSFGKPVLFPVNGSGLPLPPAPALKNDPNYETQWDFFECTYVPQGSDGLFNFNLSQLQSGNLPVSFQVAGTEPSNKMPVNYTRGWNPGGHAKFLSQLAANADFKKLVLPKTNRALAPGLAIPVGLFSADYFKGYIADVWTKFETDTLTFVGDPPPNSNKFVTFTGKVANGKFTFTTDDASLKLEPIVFNKPTTSDIFENNTFCASGCGKSGNQQNYTNQIFGTLCAAFNRSVMLSTTELGNAPHSAWCFDKKKFYATDPTNYYAKYIHENSIKGLAYGFQSDDHCDTSSYVSVLNPTELKITFLAA